MDLWSHPLFLFSVHLENSRELLFNSNYRGIGIFLKTHGVPGTLCQLVVTVRWTDGETSKNIFFSPAISWKLPDLYYCFFVSPIVEVLRHFYQKTWKILKISIQNGLGNPLDCVDLYSQISLRQIHFFFPDISFAFRRMFKSTGVITQFSF